ncbi:MAG: hypothetical protein JXR69_00800 [Candidatus Delongbacteria bacterium]|nr:hypothetical protein [Candidatus Delongbacteria bacterium]
MKIFFNIFVVLALTIVLSGQDWKGLGEHCFENNEYLKLNKNKDGDAQEFREQIKTLGFEPKY